MNLEFIRSLVDSTFYVLACCIAHDTPGRRMIAEGLARFGVLSWDYVAVLTALASVVYS